MAPVAGSGPHTLKKKFGGAKQKKKKRAFASGLGAQLEDWDPCELARDRSLVDTQKEKKKPRLPRNSLVLSSIRLAQAESLPTEQWPGQQAAMANLRKWEARREPTPPARRAGVLPCQPDTPGPAAAAVSDSDARGWQLLVLAAGAHDQLGCQCRPGGPAGARGG